MKRRSRPGAGGAPPEHPMVKHSPYFSISLFLILVLSLSAAALPALAAEGHEPGPALPGLPPSGAAQAEPGESPWEHSLWANATTMMRIYLCDHARRPPSWCGEPRELPGKAELPAPQGPPLIEEDARWLTFLDQADPNNLSEEDVATIRLRATKRRDPQAMEILGFLYAEGISVDRDYAESYRWYGLAYLLGEARVRSNMDVVWQQLQRHDLEGAQALARDFNALAAGEVPESFRFMAPPAAPDPAPDAPAGADGRSPATPAESVSVAN
ncbi:MAG: hypothetical protein Tsb0032_22680 [Kiloniellaceae bacterium]